MHTVTKLLLIAYTLQGYWKQILTLLWHPGFSVADLWEVVDDRLAVEALEHLVENGQVRSPTLKALGVEGLGCLAMRLERGGILDEDLVKAIMQSGVLTPPAGQDPLPRGTQAALYLLSGDLDKPEIRRAADLGAVLKLTGVLRHLLSSPAALPEWIDWTACSLIALAMDRREVFAEYPYIPALAAVLQSRMEVSKTCFTESGGAMQLWKPALKLLSKLMSLSVAEENSWLPIPAERDYWLREAEAPGVLAHHALLQSTPASAAALARQALAIFALRSRENAAAVSQQGAVGALASELAQPQGRETLRVAVSALEFIISEGHPVAPEVHAAIHQCRLSPLWNQVQSPAKRPRSGAKARI